MLHRSCCWATAARPRCYLSCISLSIADLHLLTCVCPLCSSAVRATHCFVVASNPASREQRKQHVQLLWGPKRPAAAPPQVDVYSFGVVLWEICTGRVPTRGRLADPDVPGDCPADILMLIRECMQVSSSPTLYAAQLCAVDLMPVEGQPPPPPPPLQLLTSVLPLPASACILPSASAPAFICTDRGGAIDVPFGPAHTAAYLLTCSRLLWHALAPGAAGRAAQHEALLRPHQGALPLRSRTCHQGCSRDACCSGAVPAFRGFRLWQQQQQPLLLLLLLLSLLLEAAHWCPGLEASGAASVFKGALGELPCGLPAQPCAPKVHRGRNHSVRDTHETQTHNLQATLFRVRSPDFLRSVSYSDTRGMAASWAQPPPPPPRFRSASFAGTGAAAASSGGAGSLAGAAEQPLLIMSQPADCTLLCNRLWRIATTV